MSPDPLPTVPSWTFASDDLMTRYVVVTDARVDMSGWSIHYHPVEGLPDSSPFAPVPVRVDPPDDFVFDDDGDTQLWAATIEAAALLDSFVSPEGRILAVDQWDAMTTWLVESMRDEPAGLIIDLGPNTEIPEDEADDIELVNAQLHVLDDGVVMVRRSHRILRQLRLVDHAADGLVLDQWHHDDTFDDCTNGYLFTRDHVLAASACVAWVRDAGGVEAANRLGCSFDFADELPRG